MICQHRSTKLITSIWLASLLSFVYCMRENNFLELSCQIITSHKQANRTHTDIKRITAVNRCAESYDNEEVIKKCEHLADSESPRNQILFKPVTNSFKNITYWNEYCATCNYQTDELEFWPSWSKLKEIDIICVLYGFETRVRSLYLEQRQSTRKFIRDHLKLESKLNNSTELKCTMKENWPMNLLNFTIPCLVDEFRKSQQTKLDSCQYIKKNGKICEKMQFIIEGLDYGLNRTGEIRLFNESSGIKFALSEYTTEHGVDNVIYLCEKAGRTHKMRYWVKIGTMTASVIFIVMYLVLNFNIHYFQSFPNKIIYSYSIGLMIMHIFLIGAYLSFIESCIMFFLAQFSWLFHFFWTVIISVEFCRLMYCTLRKRRVTISAQHGKYLVYCIFGYVLPTIIPIIYFLILETAENQCPPLQDYFAVPCTPAKGSVAEYFMNTLLYIFDYSFTFFIPVLFLLQSGVLIYLTKCGPTPIRSTANRNHLIVLMKMGYIMGAHWLLYELCFWHGFSNSFVFLSVELLSELFIDLQGVFVFFAFGFKKGMLISILHKCKCKGKFTEEVGDNVTETSTQFQSPSSVGRSNSTEAG